jgi:hypothetical protein
MNTQNAIMPFRFEEQAIRCLAGMKFRSFDELVEE